MLTAGGSAAAGTFDAAAAAGAADAEADAAGVDRGYRRGKHGMVVPFGKTMSSAGGAAGGKKSPTGVPHTSCASDSPTARGPACHIWFSCLTDALRCSSWGPACRRPSSTRSSHSCSRRGHELGVLRHGLFRSGSPETWYGGGGAGLLGGPILVAARMISGAGVRDGLGANTGPTLVGSAAGVSSRARAPEQAAAGSCGAPEVAAGCGGLWHAPPLA